MPPTTMPNAKQGVSAKEILSVSNPTEQTPLPTLREQVKTSIAIPLQQQSTQVPFERDHKFHSKASFLNRS